MPRMITAAPPLIAEPLWQRTRASFARAIEAIGTPTAIAALTLLTRDLRRAIAGRILRLEHLVRKLLLAEATELHRAELERAKRRVRIERVPLRGIAQHWRPGSGTASLQARTGSAVAEKCEPGGARSNLDRAKPKTWPARFCFALPRNTHLVPNTRAPRIRALWGPDTPPRPAPERTPRVMRDEDTPFRLACRLEALRRVLADPKPHAVRLARVLAREARRVPHLIHRYAFAAARTNDYEKEDYRLGIDVYGVCIDAPAAFRDTS
jgi:hypothetical protein